MTADEIIAAIRNLHAPIGTLFPECRGCDSDGWEGEDPDWPCRTAKVVYSIAEIETVAQEGNRAREADRAQRATQPPSPTAALIPDLWGPKIHEILAQQSLLDRLNRRVNEDAAHRTATELLPDGPFTGLDPLR